MRFSHALRLGRIAGIDIGLDWSLLIIFALIVVMLAEGAFPTWHPQWSPGVAWGTAVAAATLFFLSVLLHELSHALVGRRVGVSIRKITLFMFGGMAHMEGEPPTWGAELVMALVGPFTSFVLGTGFLLLAAATLGGRVISINGAWEALPGASPFATLLLWLGPVNIILALFNLVPGFPLDGGRALRAILWAISGNMVSATRWASRGGQAFAWLLIVAGIGMIFGLRLPVFGGGLINGLWIAFIGWFLNNAALASYRQLLVRESLEQVPVSRLMQSGLTAVTPGLSVASLVDDVMPPSGQRAFPVEDQGRLLGMVFLTDLKHHDRRHWHQTAVRSVMIPAESLIAVEPQRDAMEALAILGEHNVNQIPVVENGRLLGLLRREDVLTWLAVHSPANARPRAAG